MKKKPVVLTCYHEAGHAVAALEYNINFESVDVLPDNIGKGGLRGCDQFDTEKLKKTRFSVKDEGLLMQDMTVLIAGLVAVAKYKGVKFGLKTYHYLGPGGSDLIEMDKLARVTICNDGVVVEQYIKYIAARTVHMFNSENVWRKCQIIANALFIKNTLSYEECCNLLDLPTQTLYS